MGELIQVELRVDENTDISVVEKLFREEFSDDPNLNIESVSTEKPFGMSGVDIAISIFISLASSTLVHVYRDKIDAAAKKISKKTNYYIKLIFKDPPN